jgi:hypothetical protein
MHQGEERLALGRHTAALGDAADYYILLVDEFLLKSTVYHFLFSKNLAKKIQDGGFSIQFLSTPFLSLKHEKNQFSQINVNLVRRHFVNPFLRPELQRSGGGGKGGGDFYHQA